MGISLYEPQNLVRLVNQLILDYSSNIAKIDRLNFISSGSIANQNELVIFTQQHTNQSTSRTFLTVTAYRLLQKSSDHCGRMFLSPQSVRLLGAAHKSFYGRTQFEIHDTGICNCASYGRTQILISSLHIERPLLSPWN